MVMETNANTEAPKAQSVEIESQLVDPVAYLGSLGIEAELVAVVAAPMAPAA